jgi:transcriptional regulator with XRE-family HTH domain
MNTLDKKIGENLRKIRKAQGVSQEALAIQLGITFQQVQKYEKGVNRIALSRAVDICEMLKINIKELIKN